MANSLAYGTITITDLSDGALSWTTTHAPTESNSNYVFEIQYLEGNEDADKKVGDLIFYDVYRYTILEVGTTTVTAGYKTSLKGDKGDTAEWYYGTALIHTSGSATLSINSTPGVIIGAMYLNTDTSLVYKCTAISGSNATWTYAGDLTTGVIDNIEVGGRNLVLGTSDSEISFNESLKDYNLSIYIPEIKVGDKLVCSFWAKASATRWIDLYFKDTNSHNTGTFYPAYNLTTEWKYYSFAFEADQYAITALVLRIRQSDSSHGGGKTGATIYIKSLKLQRGNIPTAWTPAPQDTEALITTAQTTANNALISANGKNKVYHQATEPSGGIYIEGDTWFDSDDGYKMYTWNGSSWIAEQLGENALADLSITNAKIANGTIDNAKIATLDAGKINTGELDARRIAANSLTLGMLSSSIQTSLTNPVEYIVGTQTGGTRYWTGVTRESSLTAGKMIAYKLPYAGTSSAAYLELTLTTGQATSTTTGRIGVYRNNSTVTNQFAAGSVINMTYDGTYWRVTGMGSDTTTNYYDRQNYKAALYASEAIAATRIAVLGTDGKLKILANSSFDMTGPILYVATEYKAADVSTPTARTTNYSFWGTAFDLSGTHAIEGATAGKPVYIVGTVSGTIFTPNETVLTCVIPEQENDLYYIKLGLMSTATTAVLESQHPLYAYYNGAFQRVDYGAQTKATEVNRTAENAFNNAQDAHDAAENALKAASANTSRIQTNESKIEILEGSTGTLSSAITALNEIIGSNDDQGLRKRQKEADKLLTLLQAEIGAFNSWLEFKANSEDPNDKTGLIIGKTGESGVYVVQIEGDAISFYENREAARTNDTERRVAFFQNHYLYVDNAKVGKNMEVGNFRWITQANGNMSLVYIGGSE